MKNQLAYAIALAAEAFKDKTDKAGKPYMLHCLRVMHKLHSEDEDLNTIAVLHDVPEDCPEWHISKLGQLGIFSTRVLIAVDLLTHKKGVPYMDYIKEIAMNGDAAKVKMADLRDNSNITRLKGLRDKDFERMQKYHNAYAYLQKHQNQ